MSFDVATVFDAFKAAPRPLRSEITQHRCDECDRVCDDLSRFEVRDLPDQVVEYHHDSLPLLKAVALRYYLPRFIEYSCTHKDGSVGEYLLYHLQLVGDSSDEYWAERIAEFTASERGAVVLYLEHRRTWEYEDEAELQRAIAAWTGA